PTKPSKEPLLPKPSTDVSKEKPTSPVKQPLPKPSTDTSKQEPTSPVKRPLPKPSTDTSKPRPSRPVKRPLAPSTSKSNANTRHGITYSVPNRTFSAPTFNYSQGQGSSYIQTYVPSVPVTYPSYVPSWTNQSRSISRVTPSATNQKATAPKPAQDKPKPTGENSGQGNSWFGANTGFDDKETKAVLDYIRKTGAAAKEKHPSDQEAYNRDIAQSLAYGAYKKDNLQKLFNIYLAQPLVKNNSALQALSATHENLNKNKNYPLDLPHMLTTLASLEKQNGRFDYTAFIKRLAVQPLINPLANPVTFIWSAFNNGDDVKRNILLQQNSLIGDLFTNTDRKDYLSDMDAIILARHPKYKDLPLDERIIQYYSQDLTIKRHQLLYEVYGTNKTSAKMNLAGEMLLSTLTLGGLGLAVVGMFKRKGVTHIGENLALLDQVVFEKS
ncbi:hypothetical protein IR117_12395, partial [Streptococcus danieliae]|nr:hypothetical protein [Streptococcus danieliae]